MELSTIRYFHKVSRSCSIREAADQLHVSASAISRKIAQLEEEFGQPLFERHARGVRLTQAGEIVQQRFQDVLQNVDTLHEQLDELKGLLRGRIRIATVEGAVAYLLPQAIANLHRVYPNLSFEIMTAGGADVVESVLEDDSDLLIAFNVDPHANISVVARVALPLFAVVGANHALKSATLLSLRELENTKIGYLTESHGTRRLLDNALNELGVNPARTLVTNSVESLKAFARHGIGITFLPRFVFEREVTTGDLIAIPVREAELLTASLVIGVRRGRRMSRSTQELIERLKDLLD